MPSKKVQSKASQRVTRPKRVKIIEVSELSLKPLRPIPISRRNSRKNLGAMVTVIGDSDDIPEDIDWNKIPRMPNPVPDNIVSLLKLAAEASWLTVPLAPYILLLIKSWFDGRNSRKLKIKNGDIEMEFQGAWSERKFQQAVDRFRKMTKHLREDNIQVIENGKVIEDRNDPAYRVEQDDIERAREMQSNATKAKTAKKGKTKGKRK